MGDFLRFSILHFYWAEGIPAMNGPKQREFNF